MRRLPEWIRSKVSTSGYQEDEYGVQIPMQDLAPAQRERVNSDIVAVAQHARIGGGSLRNVSATRTTPDTEDEEPSGWCCGCCPYEEEANVDHLKEELEMDDHSILVTKLFERLGNDKQKYVSVQFDADDGQPIDEYTPFSINLSDLHGLSAWTVDLRQEEHGSNVLTPPKTKPEYLKFLAQVTDFFSLLLWTGSFLCLVAYGLQTTIDNLALAVVLAAVVLITGIFGYLQEKKASNLMESFKNMMPDRCTVVRDGGDQVIDATEVVPGDIVKIKYGQKIPADLRILWASDDMAVDNSSLTGEADAIRKTNLFTDDNPLETSNLAFFGTMCPKGQAIGVVVRTGDATVMGRIARLATSTDTAETPINREINHFVHIISGVAILLGVVFFGLGFAVGTYWASNLAFMIGIIVANVPEGLLITVTVCLTLTANRMAANSVLVKNLRGVETLGSTTCICSDKTGTLTQNIMTVQHLCFDGKIYDTSCGVLQDNIDRTSSSYERIVRAANVCNTAKFDQRSKVPGVPFSSVETLADGSTQERINWQCIGDATESALIKFIQGAGIDVDRMRSRYAQIVSIPFNSSNKYMVSVNALPETGAPLVTMKGAPERVLARCDRILVDGKIVPLEGEVKERVSQMQAQCGANGLRVLGFAELECDPEKFNRKYKFEADNPNFPIGNDPDDPKSHPNSTAKLVFLGLFAIIDPPRPQVKSAVAKCKAAGIRVIMVTGDHPATAKAIAKQVGIVWGDRDRGGPVDGPATQEDYVKWNEEHGLTRHRPCNIHGDRWFDPRLAPAIIVPGWEIDPSYSDYWELDEDTGTKRYKISPAKWDDILGHTQIVFARTSPQQKLVIVENCQKRGEIVAVTGDGVNDAPALKRADIGIAMGIAGSEVSKQAADMILMDDNFASIVAGIEEGRLIFDNLKKSICYTLSSNIPEIAPFLFYITIQIPQALSTILILFVDLGTDMVPAISMAWENAESDIMKRPPRDAERDRLVTTKLIFHSYLQVGVIQAMAGFFTFFVVMHDYGFPAHTLLGAAQFDNFGAGTLFCKNNAGSSVKFVTPSFDPTSNASTFSNTWSPDHFLWYDLDSASYSGDTQMSCTFASRNVKGPALGTDAANPVTASYCSGTTVEECWDVANPDTYYNADGELFTSSTWVESFEEQVNLINSGYVPYVPWKGKNSPFWDNEWLHQDVYGGNANFASTVPGLGRAAGTADRASGDCSAGSNCEDPWVNVDDTVTLTPLVHFGYGALARFVTHVPVVQPSSGVIPATPDDLDGTNSSCSEPQPGRKSVCDQVAANSAQGGYLYYREHYGVTEGTRNGSFTVDFTALGTAEIMDRNGINGTSSNTLALATKWSGCTATGLLCKGASGTYKDTSCSALCLTLPYGFSYATVRFSSTSFYGAGYQTVDWSTFGDLGCNMTTEYPTELSVDSVARLADTDFCLFNRRGIEVNVASRMVQREALANAQAAYFVSIVVAQWADLLICKTRMNSIREQGMLNFFLNFGLVFETLCAVILCYTPYLNTAIGFRPIRFLHWTPGVPYSFLTFAFDEIRKWLMRRTSYSETNPVTGQVIRVPGWLERNSYY